MAMVNPRQPSNPDMSRAYSLTCAEVGNSGPREVSFSSYLNPAEEAFVHKLVQSGRSLSFKAEPESERLFYLGRKEEDGEIGVFEAEKYFNGEIDDQEDSPKSVTPSKKFIHLELQDKSRGEEPGRDIVTEPPARPRLHMGTPSIHSESSMNSQTALLQNVSRVPRKKGNKVNAGLSLLAAIGCKCSCSDKGSVDVAGDENIVDFGTTDNAKSRVDVFPAHNNNALPVSDPWASEEIQAHKPGKSGSFSRKAYFDLPSLKPGNQEETKPRKSLEVFGSPLFGKNETFDLERKLTMLGTWKPEKEANAEVFDETASDASSDLFEIESLTGKVNSYLTRQTSDATSDCPTPTTARYAPSEASIEWSVVTASAADFSVISDTEEAASGSVGTSRGLAGRAKNGAEEEVQRRRSRPSILLGCKSQKAVRIAGEAHRSSSRLDPRMAPARRLNLSSNPVARFHAEARLMGFDPKYGKHGSHLLYVGK